MPEYHYAGTILLIPFVVFIVSKIYKELDREENHNILVGFLILLVAKGSLFWLLNWIPAITYVNLSVLSSLGGLILMTLYLIMINPRSIDS